MSRELSYDTFQQRGYRTKIRSWRRLRRQVPRWAVIPLVVTAVCTAIGLVRGLNDALDQYLKTYPTDFEGLRLYRNASDLRGPTHPIRFRSGAHIDEKYTYLRGLGKGCEGRADLYADTDSGYSVVVKTFTGDIRNPLPSSIGKEFEAVTTTWPSEIEAGIKVADEIAGFVPVYDYFILVQQNGRHGWAMVSPYVHNGTLVTLSNHESATPSSASQLDEIHRPALMEMLTNLGPIHAAGYCHDDIKPDNIFIGNSAEWLLGDLGNFRHLNHTWHFTRSWKRQNQWSECRYNDIRRALKSYLWFLRMASVDQTAFDKAFWSESEDWARIYWTFVRKPSIRPSVVGILDIDGVKTDHGAAWNSKSDYAKWSLETERELHCTGISSRFWRWYEYLEWY